MAPLHFRIERVHGTERILRYVKNTVIERNLSFPTVYSYQNAQNRKTK